MTLAVVAQQCERFYGASWYFNRDRWATIDGYAPWGVVWVAWRAMQAVLAYERLSMSRAISLGMGAGDAAARARQDELRAAFPAGDEDTPWA